MAESEEGSAEDSPGLLGHIGVYSLTAAYWSLPEGEREALRSRWAKAMAGVADATRHYRTFPTRTGSDFLVWCTVRLGGDDAPSSFFDDYSRALRPFRRYVTPAHILWGLTGRSPYGRSRPRGRIDPFSQHVPRHLIVYPFSKTPEWYLMGPEARQAMMDGHIRIGRNHRGVSQLLLYSTGLQDHEFVVLYETDDLGSFSDLVRELRATESRLYTLLDAPVHVGTRADPMHPADLWP